MLSSFLVCTHIGEMGKDERRDNVHFPPLVHHRLPTVLSEYRWSLLSVGTFDLPTGASPAVNYPKANVPRVPLHSEIWTYKLNNRVRVFYMIFSSIFICEHENSIGGYKGPTMFELGLLRTLGQFWVSLRTSQVHRVLFM